MSAVSSTMPSWSKCSDSRAIRSSLTDTPVIVTARHIPARAFPVDDPVQTGHGEEQQRRPPPKQSRFQYFAVFSPLKPEQRAQIPRILAQRFFTDPHLSSDGSTLYQLRLRFGRLPSSRNRRTRFRNHPEPWDLHIY